jgi:tRNA(fMet)-specific endonuclease VapC
LHQSAKGFDLTHLLDTNVVIALRDGDGAIERRVAELEETPSMSIVTRVELEGGLDIEPEERKRRRERLDLLLDIMPVLVFGAPEADALREIIAAAGFARSKILDRMIAAQAVASNLVLVIANGRDFRQIPFLRLEDWSN